MLIVPAAGESNRFGEAGFPGPKAMLKLEHGGVTRRMLAWLCHEMPDDDVRVGVREQDAWRFEGYPWQVHVVPDEWRAQGQAGSVAYLVDLLRPRGPFSLANCDVMMDRYGWERLLACDFGVSVFHDEREQWKPSPYSYVSAGGENGPTFAEKVAISENAIAGFYRLPGWEQVMEAYEAAEYVRPEKYLSEMLGCVEGRCKMPEVSGYHDLGTPEACAAAGFTIIE